MTKQYTDEQLRELIRKHTENSPHDRDAVFYAVCLELLGYTPLGQFVPDMTEFNEFERRYQTLEPFLAGEQGWRLKIGQFQFNNGGGQAAVALYGKKPDSAFEQQPFLSMQVCFSLHTDKPACNRESQELMLLPGESGCFILTGFTSIQSVHASREYEWPQPSEYRGKVARMIANMVACAELPALNAPLPTVLCP